MFGLISSILSDTSRLVSILPPPQTNNQVHLRASNSSLVRVSAVDISLQTPAIVLASSTSPPLLHPDGSNNNAHSRGDGSDRAEEDGEPSASSARLSLDGGALAANASARVELGSPGVFFGLVGRQCGSGGALDSGSDGCSRSSGGGSGGGSGSTKTKTSAEDVLGGGMGRGLGELVADADVVHIRAGYASAGGVFIAAGGPSPEAGDGDGAAAAAPSKGGVGAGEGTGENGATPRSRLEVRVLEMGCIPQQPEV